MRAQLQAKLALDVTSRHRLASDFRALSYMRTDEYGISKVLADPRGPHGHSDIYRLFDSGCFSIRDDGSIDLREDCVVSDYYRDILVRASLPKKTLFRIYRALELLREISSA